MGHVLIDDDDAARRLRHDERVHGLTQDAKALDQLSKRIALALGNAGLGKEEARFRHRHLKPSERSLGLQGQFRQVRQTAASLEAARKGTLGRAGKPAPHGLARADGLIGEGDALRTRHHPVFHQRSLDRDPDRVECLALVLELDFALGGGDIHVEPGRIEFQGEGHEGIALFRG